MNPDSLADQGARADTDGLPQGSASGATVGSAAQHEPSSPNARRPLSRAQTSPRARSASMSFGSQALLQILNAVGDFDAHHPEEETAQTAVETSTDDEASETEDEERLLSGDEQGAGDRLMASSILAIHRPIDFQRRATLGPQPSPVFQEEVEQQYGAGIDQSEAISASPMVAEPEEMDGKTIVHATSSRSTASRRSTLGSRQERRAQLAVMLKDIFDLEDLEEVVAEFRCQLFRSILLQGYLYLTAGHICFYAYLRNEEGQTIKSGTLAKKSSLTGRFHRHWFILRDDTLSWYPSSQGSYFLDGDVSLQYCIGVEPSHKHRRQFKILTADRRIYFQADTEASKDEWIRLLRKAVFQCQNEGESVKIALPLETVVNVESSKFDIIDVLRIQVMDDDSGEDAEDYHFCHFSDLQDVLSQLHAQLDSFREKHAERSLQAALSRVSATESPAEFPPRLSHSTQSNTHPARLSTSSSVQASVRDIAKSDTKGGEGVPADDASNVDKLSESQATTTRETIRSTPPTSIDSSVAELATYPPRAVKRPSTSLDQGNSWAEWLKSKAHLHNVTSRIPSLPTRRRVTEVVSRPRRMVTATSSWQTEQEPSSDSEEGPKDVGERFRSYFNLPEKEILIAAFPVYLYRSRPLFGKLYVSEHFACFRATARMSKTKMKLPMQDIIFVEPRWTARTGYYGLVLTIKSHGDICFEIQSKQSCNQILRLLTKKMEQISNDSTFQSSSQERSRDLEEAEQLRKLEPSPFSSVPITTMHGSLEEVAPSMVRSDTSSFLIPQFRPSKRMHITCLTIGSRGDVQPYIALCKGLMKEGQRCRIASHAEYQEWVEGHGIEFRAVGGDPAELMRICVDNGMFTVSFMREGVSKFRGWLDDLLETSWNACRGTDLLIESPSTMAGIHIAEALQIPYYRAFTMPWTKTRAYPHAFAVPEHRLGGTYNTLSYKLFDNLFWKAIAGQINRWRETTLGLHSTSLKKMEAKKTPFLYNFSSSVVPPPIDWPAWIYVTGYWFLDQPDDSATKKWAPADSLVAFLDKAKIEGKKVVYIGFGSIVVPDPEGLTHIVSNGVQKSDVYAIVSKGWSGRLVSKVDSVAEQRDRAEQEKRERKMMTDRIYIVEAIPHDWLFDRINAACHHGGAGTTGASLRAGIPTIIKPFFGDQYFWASRVEALGVGSSLRKLTAETLADALTIATTDAKQIARAKIVGQEIRKEDGVRVAIECIFRDFQLAQDLIKRNTRRVPPKAQTEGFAASQPSPDASSTTPKKRRPRSTSGVWLSGETDDESSSWDHLSRGSRPDTDDEVLSRSGFGSSPFLSPTGSLDGRWHNGNDRDGDGCEPADAQRRSRRTSESTPRSPSRLQYPFTSSPSRNSTVLPRSLNLTTSRSRDT